jgi:hypothetical protein
MSELSRSNTVGQEGKKPCILSLTGKEVKKGRKYRPKPDKMIWARTRNILHFAVEGRDSSACSGMGPEKKEI